MNDEWIGVCPGCFSEITNEALFAEEKLAFCRQCDGAFVVSGAPAIPQIPKRPEKHCGITLERRDDRLIVDVPPSKIWMAWIFVLGFVFCTFFVVMIALNPDDSFPSVSVQIGMGSFFVLFDLLMLYLALDFFFYRRRLVFDAEQLNYEGRLFFLRFRKTIPRSEIWGLRSNWTPTQMGTIFSFHLTHGKKTLEITCRSREEQQWVASEINGFLNATAEERLCCPTCHRGVIDRSINRHDPNERKCIWCGVIFDREEAARIGAAELDTPWRSEYDLLRPLDAPVRVEQNEDGLAIFFGNRGVQGNWEKFGIVCIVLLAASFVPEIAFLFHPDWQVKIVAGNLFVISAMLFGLFGWIALATFWISGSLRITRDAIHAEGKFPFCKKRVFQVDRSPDAWAEPTAISDQIAGSFSLSTTGKYQLTLFNGDEKHVQIKSRSDEEIQWLLGLINRFLARTNEQGAILRAKCPTCRSELSLKNFQPGAAETLHCPACRRDFSIFSCLNAPAEILASDTVRRPRTAKAVIQNCDENELVIDYPSRIDMQYGPRVRMITRLFFIGCFALLGVMWFSCNGWVGVKTCRVFFQVFDPLKAVLMSMLVIACTSGAVIAYFLMFWAIANLSMTSWTLHIDRDKIRLTTRAFFTTKQTKANRSDEVHAESVKENYGFNWRKWLQVGYWFDAEPAWSRSHIQLTTRPLIPFPFHNEEEKEWLLRSINDFLQESK